MVVIMNGWMLGKKKKFVKRQQGGGSIMIWAGFTENGRTDIAFCDERLNSSEYTFVLENHLLPFLQAHDDDECESMPFILQHDNAPSHTAKDTKE